MTKTKTTTATNPASPSTPAKAASKRSRKTPREARAEALAAASKEPSPEAAQAAATQVAPPTSNALVVTFLRATGEPPEKYGAGLVHQIKTESDGSVLLFGARGQLLRVYPPKVVKHCTPVAG